MQEILPPKTVSEMKVIVQEERKNIPLKDV